MTYHPKHILVPVAVGASDDITVAEHLVDAAADLAMPNKGRLTIVYVDTPRTALVPLDTGSASPAAYQAMAQVWESNRTSAIEVLKRLRIRAEAVGVPAATELLEPIEGTGESIAHVAKEAKVDLIALASHGRRGIKRLFLGSVAERVAHLATTPVLILPAAMFK